MSDPKNPDEGFKPRLVRNEDDARAQTEVGEDQQQAEEHERALTIFRRHGVSLNRVVQSPLEWFIPGWIPMHGLTVIFGVEGVGKTSIAGLLAALVTIGRRFRGLEIKKPVAPKDVLVFSAEDEPGQWAERIEACGGDTSRVHLLDKFPRDRCKQKGCERKCIGHPVDYFDMDFVRAAVGACNVGLVIFESMTKFTRGASTSSYEQMYRALSPLADLSMGIGVPMLMSYHANKKTDIASSERVQGTRAINAVARSVLMVSPHPDAEEQDKDLLLMSRVKGNARKEKQSICFERLSASEDTGYAVFVGMEDMDADTVSACNDQNVRKKFNGGAYSKHERAKETRSRIHERLKAGKLWSKDIPIEAETLGVSIPTFKRHLKSLSDQNHASNLKCKEAGGYFWISTKN